MRADLEIADRHPAGRRWAHKLEEETGIHMDGLRWDLWPSNGLQPIVRDSDTAWMLAYICPRTWRAARNAVLRAIAGRPHRGDIRLVSPVKERDREAAIAALDTMR